MQARARNAIAGVIITAFIAIPIVACTDGTTPDCSGPEAGCSADLSGSLESGAAADDANTSYGDSAVPTDSGKPTPTDAGDASLDAADAHG
ncbi:MAG: hypothetical protein ABI183_21815 [Polyangiaceae bacterium]